MFNYLNDKSANLVENYPCLFSNGRLHKLEPVLVNAYGAQESIPPAYLVWRAGTSNRVVVPARQAGNRFLGSLKGLHIRAQAYSFACLYHSKKIEIKRRTWPLRLIWLHAPPPRPLLARIGREDRLRNKGKVGGHSGPPSNTARIPPTLPLYLNLSSLPILANRGGERGGVEPNQTKGP
jgi:hypothetical protein